MRPDSDGPVGNDDGQAEKRAAIRQAEKAIQKAMSRLPWLGAKEGPLVPLSNPPPPSFQQNFHEAGVYTEELSSDAFEIHGDIRIRFDAIKGNITHGNLGVPVTDETWARDHVGRFNNFVGGSIYWTPETKAWEVYGDIAKLWFASNAELGWLKYPINGESSIGRGRFQSFQNGTVYWLPSSGAVALPQVINDHYNSLGGPLGSLGFPLVKELPENGRPGTYFKFEFGKIHWQGTAASIFVEMNSRYTFSVDTLQCESMRSREKDTLYISNGVGLSLRDPLTTSHSLGDHGVGFTPPNIQIPNVSIADDDVGTFTYMVVNNGHQSSAQALSTLESGVKALAQKAGEAAGAAAGEAAVDALAKHAAEEAANEAMATAGAAAVAAAVGSVVGATAGAPAGGPVGSIVGGALGALSAWLVGEGIDLLTPDCDGLVAAGSPPLAGVILREGTAQTGVYTQVDQCPGSDSPAGCGDNSYYVVTWSIRKVG